MNNDEWVVKNVQSTNNDEYAQKHIALTSTSFDYLRCFDCKIWLEKKHVGTSNKIYTRSILGVTFRPATSFWPKLTCSKVMAFLIISVSIVEIL